MRIEYPNDWTPGQLLDLKKFTDGSCRATLLGEDYKAELNNGMHFSSMWEAQAFVSWWYAPSDVRERLNG